MSDYLLNLSSHPVTRRLVKGVGAPTPRQLRRAAEPYATRPLADQHVVFEALAGGTARGALADALAACGATPAKANGAAMHAVLLDTTGLAEASGLRALYDFFHAVVPNLAANARVLVVAAPPDQTGDSEVAAARRGVEGFVRSLAKELGKRGATANLLNVEDGAEARLEGPLRFFLSPRCAYVTGQPVRVSRLAHAPSPSPAAAPLRGKIALVTGAARGIGAETVRRLTEEGAQVVCLDLPSDDDALARVALAAQGVALEVDVSGGVAAAEIARFVEARFGGIDIIVHNAGVTRDRTVAKMDERGWDQCLAVNLEAVLRLDRVLERAGLLRDEARVVCLSSIAGIAGNVGQTNYAAAKSALMGYVAAQARRLAPRGICVNAVAPGFIETRMMLAVPFLFREFARRGNSLSQGGTVTDAAELIAFLCTPGASGVTGQTIRVCGQSLIGA